MANAYAECMVTKAKMKSQLYHWSNNCSFWLCSDLDWPTRLYDTHSLVDKIMVFIRWSWWLIWMSLHSKQEMPLCYNECHVNELRMSFWPCWNCFKTGTNIFEYLGENWHVFGEIFKHLQTYNVYVSAIRACNYIRKLWIKNNFNLTTPLAISGPHLKK